MSDPIEPKIKVWDAATRLFHWGLVIGVVICWFTGDDKGLAYRVHTLAGYVVLCLVLFRVLWGFVGNERARFGDFVAGWRTVRGYVAGLVRLRPPRYVGHNPLGGWMVILLLVMLLAILATGLLGASGIKGSLLEGLLTRAQAHRFEGIHEALANLLYFLVAIHVVGVLVDMLLTRENLIRAMFDGSKPKGDAGVGDAKGGHYLAAILAALPFVVLLFWLVARTSFA